MKYVLPFTAAAVAQIMWNIVLAANLGNPGNSFGDWVFARNCVQTLCDGNWVIVAIWVTPFAAITFMLARSVWRKS